jgi:DNA-binding transcriptional MocR family regulator
VEIVLDKESKLPIYVQIAEQIKRQIMMKELLPGMNLVPERKLALELSVNRSTVLNAYEKLKQEGMIASKVGQGTVVLAGNQREIHEEEPCWNQLFSDKVKAFDSLLLKETMPLLDPRNVISFGLGIANHEDEPRLPIHELAIEIEGNLRCKALSMAPIGGFSSLRELLAKEMVKRGIICSSNQILLLSGSQQGIDLAARIMIEPGDIVIVESPSYFLALQSFRATGARIMEIPIDENGMRIDHLEQMLKRYHPKLIYTMPNYQNPSSCCMSMERRKKLIELAHRHDIIILEDDAYGEFVYDQELLPTLTSLDSSGHVILLKSFSKTISPGLRLGYMVAHKKIIEMCCLVRQGEDVHPNSISQWLVEKYLETTDVEHFMEEVCERNKKKRDIMYEALLKHAPTGMTFRKPRGGLYIWCELPEHISAMKLLERTLKRNVAIMPGNSFFLTGEGDSYIRLNFSYPSEHEIKAGIRVLCEEAELIRQDVQEEVSQIDIIPMY